MPVAKIWNNYSVAYVSNAVSEDLVVFYLENEGCQDVITLSGQKVPFVSSISPVASADNEYLDQRLRYFSDMSSSYRLFYIPEKYQDGASRAIAKLSREMGIEAGLDSIERYPWMVPLICLAAYIILFIASKCLLRFIPSLNSGPSSLDDHLLRYALSAALFSISA